MLSDSNKNITWKKTIIIIIKREMVTPNQKTKATEIHKSPKTETKTLSEVKWTETRL